MLIEGLYIEAMSKSLSGTNINAAGAEVSLKEDKGYKVFVTRVGGGKLGIRRKPKSMISLLEGSTELQRGYDDYTVEGEEEEMALGPVKHVSFIIHGIGEAMWRREDVKLPGLVETVEIVRASVNKKMYESWKLECERCERRSESIPAPPNRIEFIPVEWYDKIHSSSSALKKNLLSTTLGTIPKLRSVANDVIFDVLMYMTPEFCEEVLNCVTDQILRLYELFCHNNEEFSQDGSVSLIGHSLGSVITWDLLSLLGDKLTQRNASSGTSSTNVVMDHEEVKCYKLPHDSSEQTADVYRAYATESGIEKTDKRGTWGPCIVGKVSKTIPFVPKFTFFLGSPLGLFLTLRGARPLFNDLRIKKQRPLRVRSSTDSNVLPTSPFMLPSGAIYNIFHPSDPVAYRIEPLLLPEDFDDSNLPKPCFLTVDGKGLRLHVQARELGDSIAKTVTGFLNTNLLEKIPSQKSIELFPNIHTTVKQKKTDVTAFSIALGGKSERVDFQLQPGVVENEYLSAVSAHTSYWTNDDLLDFLIQCANRS